MVIGRAPRRPGITQLSALIAGCVISGIAGALLMSAMQPDSVARDQGAPITVTAPVEKGVLSQTVTVRGEVGYAALTSVEYRGSEAGVVVGVGVARGDEVAEGVLLLDVSGRPVIALQGTVAMYRDMALGDSGEDVRQLTGALARLGLLAQPGETYTAGAAAALAQLYEGLGYAPPPPPAQAQEALTAATEAVDQAQAELAAAKASVTSSGELAAELALEQARAAWAADPGSKEAKLSFDLAQEQLNEAQNPPSVTAANSALTAAQGRLADAKTAAAPVAPVSEITFVPALPAKVTGEPPTVGARTEGVLLEIGAGRLGALLALTAAQHSLVGEGDEVTVESDDAVTRARGRVAVVGTELATAPDGAEAFVAEVTLDGADASLAGQSVKVTVTVSQSDGPVLHVPRAAVLIDADGMPYVERWLDESGSGRAERTPVSMGMTTNGSIEVRSEALREGDRVVIDGTGG